MNAVTAIGVVGDEGKGRVAAAQLAAHPVEHTGARVGGLALRLFALGAGRGAGFRLCR
ncbi:hypothetical protein ACVW1C_007302 [Bradyrhizobium sp. USDA 4011]